MNNLIGSLFSADENNSDNINNSENNQKNETNNENGKVEENDDNANEIEESQESITERANNMLVVLAEVKKNIDQLKNEIVSTLTVTQEEADAIADMNNVAKPGLLYENLD